MVCIFCIEASQWWSILKYILPFNFSILKKVLFIIASVCRLIKSETISTNKGPTAMRHFSRDSVWLDIIFGVNNHGESHNHAPRQVANLFNKNSLCPKLCFKVGGGAFTLRSWDIGDKKDASCIYAITDMAFWLEHFVRTSIVLLLTFCLCNANIQSVTTTFSERKSVATSHTTLQKISKIKCVEKCNKERQNGMCTLAGYDKRTKTCYLSNDDPQNVLDTNDEMTGVFFYGPDMNGIISVFLITKNTDLWKITNLREDVIECPIKLYLNT